MERFIGCICDNDLQQLVIQGEASAIELGQAWYTLFLEYCDLADQVEVKYKIRLSNEIRYLKAKIEVTETCIDYLRTAEEVKKNIPNIPIGGMIECLQQIGFEYDLDQSDPVQFLKEINRIEAELRPDKLRLQSKTAEYETIKEGSTNNDQVERRYFITLMARLNNHFKRDAVNMQTTVEMYCALLRDFEGAIEANRKN